MSLVVLGCSNPAYQPPTSGPTAIVEFFSANEEGAFSADAVIEIWRCRQDRLGKVELSQASPKKSVVVRAGQPLYLDLTVETASQRGSTHAWFVPKTGGNYRVVLLRAADGDSFAVEAAREEGDSWVEQALVREFRGICGDDALGQEQPAQPEPLERVD